MGHGERLGITIGTAFGLVYVLVNAGALPSTLATVLRVAAVVAFLGVQVAMRSAPAPGTTVAERPRTGFGRGYWAVVAVEVVALVAGAQLLTSVFDAPEAGVAWVSVVVGLHFHALAVVWRQSSLHVLAIALTVCGVVGLALALTGGSEAAVATVGGVLPGMLLLAGGAAATTVARRAPVRQAT